MEYPYSISVGKLPSRGLSYTGVDTIRAKALSVQTAKMLRTVLETENYYDIALAFNTAIKDCIDMDYRKLTYGDKFYLLMWLRINSLGQEFLVNYTCHNDIQVEEEVEGKKVLVTKPCMHKQENYAIDLTKFPVSFVAEDYMEPTTIAIEVNGKPTTLDLSFHTCGDEEAVISLIKSNKLSEKEDIFARYASTIKRIDDRPVQLREALQFLMTSEEGSPAIQMVRKFFNTYDHGMSLEYEFKCPKCGGARTALVPFRAGLFVAPTVSDDDFRRAIVVKSNNKHRPTKQR